MTGKHMKWSDEDEVVVDEEQIPLLDRLGNGGTVKRVSSEKDGAKDRKKARRRARLQRRLDQAEGGDDMDEVVVRKAKGLAKIVETDEEEVVEGEEVASTEREKQGGSDVGGKKLDEDVLQIQIDTDSEEDEKEEARTYAGVVKGPAKVGTMANMVKEIRIKLNREIDLDNVVTDNSGVERKVDGDDEVDETCCTGQSESVEIVENVENMDVDEENGREVNALNGGKRKGRAEIWGSIKKVKMLLDEIEDGGGRKDLIRRVRSELDEVLEISTRLGEVKGERTVAQVVPVAQVAQAEKCKRAEKQKDREMEVGRSTVEKAGKAERIVTEVIKQRSGPSGETTHKSKRRVTNGRDIEYEQLVGEITPNDLLIQIYDGLEGWTMDMIREAFWRSGRMEEEGVGRGELDRWRLVKRQRTGVETLNYIVRVPLRSYICLTDGIENRVRVGGKWVKFVKYVELPSCWNCSRYGHMKGECRRKVRCRKCGEAHLPSMCQAEELKCVVCLEYGLEDLEHRALGADCLIHNQVLEEKRMRVAEYVAGRTEKRC